MHYKSPIGYLLGVFGLGAVLLYAGPTWTQEPSLETAVEAGQDGVEPLTRGPIHEAFAAPIDLQSGSSPIVAQEPPAPLDEVPSDQKPEGDNVEWVPGYWSWEDERRDFIWLSGFWRAPPPGRRWIPGRWQAADGGFQWVPGLWTSPQQNEIQYLPPPPDSAEIGPSIPAPNDNSVYVPGSWVYQTSRYQWRPGGWIDDRPGFVWVPSYYSWTPCGFVQQGGYWDYDLSRRGLLFAPVFIQPHLRLGLDWLYRPRYVVNNDFLYGSLFIRPTWRHYYFGDYFDAGYRNRGFVPWGDFRIGRYARDPLWSHYRTAYRQDPFWNRGINDLYAGRIRGDIPRPPRTFGEQRSQISNRAINRNVNASNLSAAGFRNVAAIGSISQVDRTAFRMQPVTAERRQAEQLAAARLRDVGRERGRVESQLFATGGTPQKSSAPARTARLNLPAAGPSRPGVSPLPPPAGASPRGRPDTAFGKNRPGGAPGNLLLPKLDPRAKADPRPGLATQGKPVAGPTRPDGQAVPRVGGQSQQPPPRPSGLPATRPEAKPDRVESKPPAPRGKPLEPARLTPPANLGSRPAPQTPPAISRTQPPPAARPQQPPVIRSQPPAAQPQAPAIRPQPPAARPQAPVIRPQPPAARPQAPAVRQQPPPAARPQAPAIRSQPPPVARPQPQPSARPVVPAAPRTQPRSAPPPRNSSPPARRPGGR